ncbi:phage virion morphogenesis protein [Dyella terrae]|uniref:phage virion morphogenesis protein n=1 Tax=Dyella terrae TaxID=522259 RepID=UPI001EFCBB97|nr:phage virion morphogenesis protein [Dyella terrae]ULU26601.1 phage virion morphogenesis protein [Dyella terrae]
MSGAQIEFNGRAAMVAIQGVANALDNTEPLMRSIGEYLLIAHNERWDAKASPDGVPWASLSPRYARRKEKARPGAPLLVYDNLLRGTLRYQVQGNELAFGTDRPYGAIQQFGGSISIAARSQQAYFHATKDEVQPLFVSKRKSNFAQWVTLPAYEITIPARPWLGVSQTDSDEILAMTQEYLQGVAAGQEDAG